MVLSLSQKYNKRFGLYYKLFFHNNGNYYYLFVESVNVDVNNLLIFFNKVKHLIEFCKVKKKVLNVLLNYNKIDNFFLYNPFILKIHKDNFEKFINSVDDLLMFVKTISKKEKRFLDFTILLNENNLFYNFNKLKDNLLVKKDYLLFVNKFYIKIVNKINIIFNIILQFLLLLLKMYNLKCQHIIN